MQVTLSFVLLNLAPHFYFSTSNQSFISKQKQEEQEMEIIKIAVWIYIFSIQNILHKAQYMYLINIE